MRHRVTAKATVVVSSIVLVAFATGGSVSAASPSDPCVAAGGVSGTTGNPGELTCTFSAPGGYTMLVPAGTLSYSLTVSGAQGGSVQTGPSTFTNGGDGAVVSAPFGQVSQARSQILKIQVGGQPAAGSTTGGSGGGGAPGSYLVGSTSVPAGGGGGTSTVTSVTGGLLLEAGGGGGAGSDPGAGSLGHDGTGAGGAGGSTSVAGGTGAAGDTNNGGITAAQGGGGGSASAGGAAGTAGTDSNCASPLQGTNGVAGAAGGGGHGGYNVTADGLAGAGGGGGGGYYGGGGGGGATVCPSGVDVSGGGGGGGGSSYVSPAATGASTFSASKTGNGSVVVTYTPSATPVEDGCTAADANGFVVCTFLTPFTYSVPVPANATNLSLDVFGASGGSSTSAAGGLGAEAYATFPTTSAAGTVNVAVGGAGGNGSSAGAGAGGLNNGGAGGAVLGTVSAPGQAGGGGGSSSVTGDGLLAIAGGGGGAASVAGGAAGQAGTTGTNLVVSTETSLGGGGGGAGSGTTPGPGGTGGGGTGTGCTPITGHAGSAGSGSHGGAGASDDPTVGHGGPGGGGGGGYAGGGGGGQGGACTNTGAGAGGGSGGGGSSVVGAPALTQQINQGASAPKTGLSNGFVVVTYTIGQPPQILGPNPPSTIKGTPFVIGFDRPVMGVSSSDFAVGWTLGSGYLPGTVTCLDASNASVSCASGPVSTAQFTPAQALYAGGYYFVDANFNTSGIVGYPDGIPASGGRAVVRAPTSFAYNQAPIAYKWGSVTNSSGTYVTAGEAGATETHSFTGTSLGIHFWYGPSAGQAIVKVAGQPAQTVDTYAATAGDQIYTFPNPLPAGKHKVTITVGPNTNASSSGDNIGIGAFIVNGTTDAAPKLTATWSDGPNHSYGYAFSREKGATITMKAFGTGFQWNVVIGPNAGKAKVYIDGVLTATEDLYAAGYSNPTYTFSLGAQGAFHTIKIVLTGTKNSASADTVVRSAGIDVL